MSMNLLEQRANTTKLFTKISKAWLPPPKLKYSEWAEQKFIFSVEDSSEPGRVNLEKAPYQIEMMNALNDPDVYKVVIMTSAQIGKTTIEKIMIGYHIDQDPGPMMIVLPNKEPMAKDWSRDRLAPMIRDCPCLSEKVSAPKLRDGENSTFHKKFPGGVLIVTGANSPADLRSRPIRILIFDEVDSFVDTEEGDPIALAEKRQTTFIRNKKSILVSTPTFEESSRIRDEYNKGTRELYKLECPHCGAYVFLNIDGMEYENAADKLGNQTVWNVTFKCPACMESFDEHTWKEQPGIWEAQSPHIKGVRSFHMGAFYSPWTPWEEIIKEYVEALGNPSKMKVVVNTLFGLPYKEALSEKDQETLYQRREPYEAELPEGVLVLTCGTDTQDDRLEYEIVGWGKGDENWGIEKGVILGCPDDKKTWEMHDERISKIFRFADGKGINVACTCIDSGGHYTTKVYEYTKKNFRRRVVSIKGQGGPGLPLIYKHTNKNKVGAMVVILGVDEGKTTISNSLKIEKEGPQYCHFPDDDKRGYGREHFKSLLSEKLTLKKVSRGYSYVWEKVSEHARNEAFDCRNYALAAKELIKPDYEALEKALKSEKIKTIDPKRPPQKRYGCVSKGIE